MVWRGNIKVLELKPKALPLIISALMHTAILFGFSIVSYDREKTFMVELVFQDSEITQQSRAGTQKPVSHQPLKERTYKPKAEIDSVPPVITPLPADEQTEPGFVSSSSNSDGRVKDMTPTISINSDDETSLLSTSQSDNGGGKTVVGSGIVESNFGSINGPSFLKMVMPEYPRLARRLGREGKVVLRLFIDEHGRLLKVEAIEKAGHGFDEAAIEAVKASAFRPAKLNGHPVECKAILPIRFKLEQ